MSLRFTLSMFAKSMCLVLLFVLLCSPLQARTFTILATETHPFKMDPDPNHPSPGISIEVLARVMKELGIEYQILFYPSVTRVLHSAKAGEAEMLIGYSFNVSRLEFLTYPKESYRTIKWNFFIRKEDQGRIRYETLEDLKGLRVGVTAGTSYTREFQAAKRFLNIMEIARAELQVPMLIRDRIDVVPLNTRSTLYQAQREGNADKIAYLPKPLKSTAYYDPVVKGSNYFSPSAEIPGDTREARIRRFLESYDRAIKKLKDNGTIQRLYQKYGIQYDV